MVLNSVCAIFLRSVKFLRKHLILIKINDLNWLNVTSIEENGMKTCRLKPEKSDHRGCPDNIVI